MKDWLLINQVMPGDILTVHKCFFSECVYQKERGIGYVVVIYEKLNERKVLPMYLEVLQKSRRLQFAIYQYLFS